MDEPTHTDETSPALAVLEQLFTAHEVPCQRYNGWLLPRGNAPGVLADWRNESHGHQLIGSLAVVVQLLDKRQIIENFAGIGRELEGIQDALATFATCDLHVMLAALWDLPPVDTKMPELWNGRGAKLEAFVGPWFVRHDWEVPVDLPGHLQTAIENEPLDQDLHWFRFFVGQVNGDMTVEALKDNVNWPTGAALLKAQPWQQREGFCSARLFLIVRRRPLNVD